MLWQLLEEGSRRPERVAAEQAERALDWAELAAGARAFACELSGRLRPGERVAALQLNTIEHLWWTFAAAGAGVVLVPLNLRLAPVEMARTLRLVGARHVLGDRALASAVQALLDHEPDLEVVWNDSVDPGDGACFSPISVSPDAPAQIYSTSGSTGEPKGVVLTHRNVATHARNAIVELELSHRDRWGHFAPMFHLADAWATFAITATGGTHVFLPRFEAQAALDAIQRAGVTITNLVPTMLRDALACQVESGRDVSSLRCLLSGGAPIARETVRKILAVFGCDYVQTYGLTETSPYLTLSRLQPHLRQLPFEQRLTYMAKTGRPFRGIDLEVVDVEGHAVPTDGETVGEIRVRGESVSPGYWEDPEATSAAFRDGWFWTGDLATLDSEGYVDIVDRKKDMILSGAENVFCVEVESALYAQPGVREAAVFGVRDERWGEAVHAALVVDDSCASDEVLLEGCRRLLAGFKVPKVVHRLDALPRSGSGKIQKRVLRERFDPPAQRTP